ncbi:hypothetical protein, partial [Bilophila wadsworthia]|uniref:hypothetical protein n=1 Tax=Bilophila wadsworthia TaxID=35833 RepID=UPI002430FE2C
DESEHLRGDVQGIQSNHTQNFTQKHPFRQAANSSNFIRNKKKPTLFRPLSTPFPVGIMLRRPDKSIKTYFAGRIITDDLNAPLGWLIALEHV